MGTFEHLKTKIFPEAVKAGSFGTDVTKFIDFELDEYKGADQYMSNVVFGDVVLERRTGERFVESVVIKTRRIPDLVLFDSGAFFHNEVLFYSKIIPSLRKYDKDRFLTACISEFLYGKATNNEQPEDDVIILKNLNKKGFRLPEERLYLDEKHIKLTLDRLGKFHALTLALQMDDPKRFSHLVCQIKSPASDGIIGGFISEEMFQNDIHRGVEPLRNDSKYQDRLSDLCVSLKNASEHMKKVNLPSKSLPVLSHGDFQRNNMMFKYGANGDPEEVAFFDFQAIRVSSPAIDMSVILFGNVTTEVRSTRWDEFLEAYYGAFSRQLEGYPKKPSFETLELDLREKGIYGYYIVSLFWPAFMAKLDGNLPEMLELDKEQLDEFIEKTKIAEVGGSKATELLVGIVKHMLDKNYIFQY